MAQAYAEASQGTVLAAHEAARRAARERQRRHLRRLIDLALEACEELNLGAGRQGGPTPAWVAELVQHLQAEAGEQRRRPQDSIEALNELFRLQERCLDRSWLEADVDAAATASVEAGGR